MAMARTAVVDARSTALSVGLFAGPRAMRRLRQASRSFGPAIGDVLGYLSPGHVYVCGGFEGALALSSVERLDPVSGMWEDSSPEL
ncbi:unnamed protein product [Prorocentrum cordatum]|uniref:Uncharacterized protein n=1 Tax=Prorocentrum cordatum TaxID=2364126 RepID=A0ABN9TQP7_9DINO|nr:unnamed protein product [Polarella glacialis]